MEKFECKDCCKEISEHEFSQHDGYCKSCYNIAQEEKDNINKESSHTNIIAGAIKTVALFAGIIGFFYGLSLFESSSSEGYAILVIALDIIAFIFVMGFGEIIQLLEDIKNKN